MHICSVVSTNYLPRVGGAELGVHSVLRHIVAQGGHRLSVVNATANSQIPRCEEIDGIEIHRYSEPPVWLSGRVPAITAFPNLKRILDKLEPDLLHISYILPGGLAAHRYATRRGIPFVLALGGADIYDPVFPAPRSLQWLAGRCIKRSPYIISYSNFTRQRMISHFGARPETVRVIPFGIDTERFRPGVDAKQIRARHGILPDQPLIFSIQRLAKRKGVDVLLRALAQTVQREPRTRALIGGIGQEAEALEKLRGELGLADHVDFVGFVEEEEKPAYYAAGDVFAFHSHYEGLGIVLEEASACGAAVVSTRAGGTVDVIDDGHSGLLVNPGDPAAMADALVALLNDPERRFEMGRNARERMVRGFSEQACGAAYLATFEEASAASADQ